MIIKCLVLFSVAKVEEQVESIKEVSATNQRKNVTRLGINL